MLSATRWHCRSRGTGRRYHPGRALLAQVETEAVIADKGYDSNALVETLQERGITPVIPPKANRKEPRRTDFALYRERNLVERFFNKLNNTAASPHASTSSLRRFWLACCWSAYSSGSTDDRP
jgi:transposase